MKRKVLLFFAMLCVSIGTWATPTVSTSTWMQNNSAYETQTVAEIYLQNAGELAEALTKVSGDFQYLHLSTNTGVGLNADDIAALNELNVKTIEMNHVSGPYFEFNNPYVEYITLPYNWTKAQVKAVGETHKNHPNFKACISTSDTENSGNATLIAYLNEAGKMRDAILHSYFDTRDYKTLGSGNGDCSRVRTLVAMGNICAKDISRAGNYDANGHYVINGVADENSDTKNKNTEGGDLYTLTETAGAIVGCHNINVIDLSEAIIPDEYCTDIVPHYGGIQTTNLREFWIPEDSNFKTIPADFMNCSAAIHQICIPGNIEVIRTRAFAGTNINYIWTTGPDPSVRYDNGATFITGANTADEVRAQRYKTEVGKEITPTENFDPAVEYPRFGANDDNSFNYGTFTLPAGLKLIERFAFYSSTSVSDVYMLNPVAPECHVDGFNSSMYHANNTVQASSIKEETDEDGNKIKIITRDAYNNGINQPMAMLHYPQETGTPNTQRYTDPTREYSIATGDRDGRGNMLYFPTQTEFEVAEWQGTYGYLWNAWDIERTWYNQEVTLGTGQGWYGNAFSSITSGYSQAGQALANEYYANNPNPNPNNTDPDKTDRSFYDVTADGSLSQPAGLDWYYNATRSGHTLYPKPETELVTDDQGYPVMVTVPVRDANGNIIYDELPSGSSYEGNYTRATEQQYVKTSDGTYCHRLIQDSNGQWVIGYTYTQDDNGDYIKNSQGKYEKYYSWMDANPQYQGCKRYTREASSLVRFKDQWNEPRFNISTDYVEYASYDNEYKNLLDRYNVKNVFVYSPAQSGDPEPYYHMRTEEVQAQSVTKQNDYRGWHQFVLAGYGYNGVIPNEPIRSFISDNDWWTICEPYDLRYNDMVMFFGTDHASLPKKIPYLSKLMYVIRDVKEGKITLMFSKNLMEYKETIAGTDQVHGTIGDTDDDKWTPEELAENPIILHKGVPYLIRPNLMVDDSGNVTSTRQFNVYKTDDYELYTRLNEAAKLGAAAHANMIYDGIYTVPSFVVGLGEEGAGTEAVESSGTKTITNKDGSSFTYKDSDNGGKLIYGGKEVSYKISSANTYSFVGSFYKSLMPQYCYFLGWDSNKNCATFWYSALQDKSGWNWNNETGIICPNFPTSTKISSATGFNDPARWKIADANGTILQPDDITMPTPAGAKNYTMDFGATNYFDMDEATGIKEVVPTTTNSETINVYNVNGVFMGNSVEGLAKGIYIVNGKKYVVK